MKPIMKTGKKSMDKIVAKLDFAGYDLISGIPPWMQMYFDKLIEKSGKKWANFPQFRCNGSGGVNFEPYKPN